MNRQRKENILAGLSALANKVYAAITSDRQGASSILDIASALKANTGTGLDVHTMRGCLNTLVKAGVVKELVPGSFRQVITKEKQEMAVAKTVEQTPISKAPQATNKPEPMDALGTISDQLRAKAQELCSIADALDAQAISIEERRSVEMAKSAKAMQVVALLKEMG